MADVPEIDTAAIRARAAAAHNEVAGLADGSREWRSYHPGEPEHDSEMVISASLADVNVLLVALAQMAADESAIPNARFQPLFELAVATLREVIGSFTQGAQRHDSMHLAVASPAALAAWRRALLSFDAAESFYRGERPPTADVEELRREFDALLPVIWAARELVGKIDPIGDRSPLAPLAAAVAELDRCGTAPHSAAAVSDAAPDGPAEGRPGIGDQSLIHSDRFVRQMNTITALRGPSAEQFEALRDAALAAGGVVVRPLIELSTSGLLWLINTTVFHPRGWALTLHKRGGEITGWHLQGDGREVWVFEGNRDEHFEAAQATLTPKAADHA